VSDGKTSFWKELRRWSADESVFFLRPVKVLKGYSSADLRPDILAGTFNPEIFTASLSQVVDFYRGRKTTIHNLYTDAEAKCV